MNIATVVIVKGSQWCYNRDIVVERLVYHSEKEACGLITR